MKIVGLEIPIEDPSSGVTTQFHAVAAYAVMLLNGTSSATFASYVSQAAWQAGKRPVAMVSAQLKEMPPPGIQDPATWFSEAVLRAEANHFSGAKPITEA